MTVSSIYLVESLFEDIDVLESWRWQIGDAARVEWITRSADAVIVQANGEYALLETGAGSLEVIASDMKDWHNKCQSGEWVSDLLLPRVVDAFIELNGDFPMNKCLGFKLPPALGGSYGPENRFAVDPLEHFSFTGYFHKEIKDLPSGASVQLKVTP